MKCLTQNILEWVFSQVATLLLVTENHERTLWFRWEYASAEVTYNSCLCHRNQNKRFSSLRISKQLFLLEVFGGFYKAQMNSFIHLNIYTHHRVHSLMDYQAGVQALVGYYLCAATSVFMPTSEELWSCVSGVKHEANQTQPIYFFAAVLKQKWQQQQARAADVGMLRYTYCHFL